MANSNYRLVLLSILTGTFLVPVNSTMIAVGLPTIADALGVPLSQASWVITIYLIVMAALQPIAGKLGDIHGKRTMFLLGMLLFLAAAAACMFSFNLIWLIIFRALQAIGGAIAAPNASALIRDVVPKEKLAQTFGMFGLLMGLGAAIGPLIGSVLIGSLGWTSIFWINIPFALFSVVAAYVHLPSTRNSIKVSLDYLGSVYLIIGLTVLTLSVTHPEYFNLWTMAVLAVTVGLFIRQELRCKEPLIQFTLFKIRMFTSANLAILLSNAIMYSTILVMPVLLQKTYHYSVQSVGILLFIFSLAMSACSWFGGSLTEKLGKKKLVGLSFLISGAALIGFLGIYYYPTFLYIAVVLLVGGIGAGIGTPSMQAASMQAVPKEMSGVASGIFSTFRYIGGMAASVMVSLMLDYHWLFYALIVMAVIGLPLSRGFAEIRGERARAG
ncbi:MFS transporter [Paenibacillus radicis (ex Xue et al. 2023)]|uniref:MFS transporter n=1 Tax=Paenibacillus radicis (ex Xue et al. 2023) TaxID=2972489 RepID=A0ABT1YR58_9BACL|nr:MFS transporter [Paenibacillus radicis (ex Xue et al. 2023)]MCR8635666.1 MFS transporter [Paenibacillus radicis (ex Xue et al. 2023)]